ncbi:MAG: hypothetical protein PHW82_13960 [Bacteroidales bacterium]|nr:hypothetical protein [Bacteroidales bacterium]
MVDVNLIKEAKDNTVVIEITSPVVNGAWQSATGPGSFHETLAQEYPHLMFVYCHDGKWQIQYLPSNDSMIEIAELISRIAQEETLYYLGKVQYLSNHPIPNLNAPENQSASEQ